MVEQSVKAEDGSSVTFTCDYGAMTRDGEFVEATDDTADTIETFMNAKLHVWSPE